ncbi:MAG TPA: carboxypeptidase-like regulatory domain-containing protein, partial [Ktedonobacteraceae bacterium]
PTHPLILPLSLQGGGVPGLAGRRRPFNKGQRAIIALLFVLSIAVVSLFAFALPASARTLTNTGRISGQLQDGTKRNAPVAGQSVTLQMAQGQNASDLKTVTTDAHGMFSFSGLNTGKTISYAVYTLYQKAQYFTDLISLSDKPVQQVNLQVFDATNSVKNIAIVQANILIDKADAQHGLLNVTENFVFENLGLTTYVGSLQANGQKPNALRFSLPAGAHQLSLKLGFDGYNVVQVDPGFASDTAVPPGQSQFAFSFQIPYSASHYDFADTIVYPTVDLSVLTPLDYHATSGTLASQGTTSVNQQSYQQLEAKQLLPGAQVHIELDGLPASASQSSSSQADQSPPWFIAIIVLMLAIVAITWFVYIRMQRKSASRRKKAAKNLAKNKTAALSQRPAQSKTARSMPEEQEKLLQDMLELDKAYEAGTIKKAEYQERRTTMKARLRVLMSAETGEKKATAANSKKTVHSSKAKS